MLARAGPKGDPIATPSICLCIILLKLNSTEHVAVCINSTKILRGKGGGVRTLLHTSSLKRCFSKNVASAVQRCYFSVEPRVVFTTRKLLPTSKKDVLPASQQSNIVYEFSCHCDSRYVGRTSQRLQDRIKQHVPKSVRTGQVSQDRKAFNRPCKLTNHEPICDSAIGQHLLTNQSCALHYSDDRFSILSKGRSAFHLSALEATYIKVSRPILCRQKEFVYTLKIFH